LTNSQRHVIYELVSDLSEKLRLSWRHAIL